MVKPLSHGRRRYSSRNQVYKNERIHAPEIRCIGPDGKQIGLMPTRKALAMAKEAGLDLVEISRKAKPPVCQILDFGKYKYKLSKKNKDNKNPAAKLKEIKFRLTIGKHDYLTKLRHAEEFLASGNPVKMSLVLRGREMEHGDIGLENIQQVITDLEHIGTPDSTKPKFMGRTLSLMFTPLPKHKRKLKYKNVENPGLQPTTHSKSLKEN